MHAGRRHRMEFETLLASTPEEARSFFRNFNEDVAEWLRVCSITPRQAVCCMALILGELGLSEVRGDTEALGPMQEYLNFVGSSVIFGIQEAIAAQTDEPDTTH